MDHATWEDAEGPVKTEIRLRISVVFSLWCHGFTFGDGSNWKMEQVMRSKTLQDPEGKWLRWFIGDAGGNRIRRGVNWRGQTDTQGFSLRRISRKSKLGGEGKIITILENTAALPN